MTLVVEDGENAREFNEGFLLVEVSKGGLTWDGDFGGGCRSDGLVMVSLGVGVFLPPGISFHR